MSYLDWIVLLTFFGYTLWDGMRQNSNTKDIQDLLLAGRRMKWWAIGVSILATQASAITFIGTTGQAFMYDMRFIQVYLGMPVAMVILSITLVPFYHKLKAYTAYESLEIRFGLPVRLATSMLFLVSRGIAVGIGIIAPAYVLALVLDLPLQPVILVIGISTTIYTLFGGMAGVIRTDLKQMALMMIGLIFCFGWIQYKLPPEVGFTEALHLAGAAGKLETIDLSFRVDDKYNIWSGLIAGTFLMLAYFGADQSQVQRYLTARSLTDARNSLLFPALVKLPMQFFILLLGAMLYVFYLFAERPLVFTPDYVPTAESHQLDSTFHAVHQARKAAAIAYLAELPESTAHKSQFISLDGQARSLHKQELRRQWKASGTYRDDTNYILPFFMLSELPIGLLGLIVAAILAATLSSIDSMLNSLAAVSIMDWYHRLRSGPGPPGSDLIAARIATAAWGVIATVSALAFGETESIIELVNLIGSYFYGTILGIFILYWIKPATGISTLIGLVAGFLAVILTDHLYIDTETGALGVFFNCPIGYSKAIAYLWLNPIGTTVVVMVGTAIGLIENGIRELRENKEGR